MGSLCKQASPDRLFFLEEKEWLVMLHMGWRDRRGSTADRRDRETAVMRRRWGDSSDGRTGKTGADSSSDGRNRGDGSDGGDRGDRETVIAETWKTGWLRLW